jgi:hypothetical protein
MNFMTKALSFLANLFQAVANMAPGQLQNEIGFLVVVLSGLGVLHVANANTFAGAVFAVVTALLALGVALERVFASYKVSLTASSGKPVLPPK